MSNNKPKNLESTKVEIAKQLDEIKEAGQRLWNLALEAERLGGNSTKMGDTVNDFSQAYIKMRYKLMKELDNLV